MKKTLKLFVTLTVFFIVISAAAVHSRAEGEDDEPQIYHLSLEVQHNQTEARSLLKLVNEMRTGGKAWILNAAGEKKNVGVLPALTYDYALEKIAIKRAEEIAVSFSREKPNGMHWQYTSYDGVGAFAECMAAGFDTAESVFSFWCDEEKEDSGHYPRRDMLHVGYNAVGIACVTVDGVTYWISEFGHENSGAKKTAADDTLSVADIEFAADRVDTAALTLSKKSLKVSEGSYASLPKAEMQVKLKDAYGDGRYQCTAAPVWKSSKSTVAKISGSRVKALKYGSATLTASLFGASAKCTVKAVHVWDGGKVTKAATAKSAGILTYTCTKCGEQKTEAIPKRKTVELSHTKYVYSGDVRKPTVTVKDENGKTVSSAYYTVTYPSGRKNVGSYKIKITFKGRYAGTVYKTFKIIPRKTAITGLTAGTKSFTVRYAKRRAQVTGYEIRYSTSKNMTDAKKTVVSDTETVSKKVSRLTAGKRYYVQVRCYKIVGEKKYYGYWSTAKSVVVK